MGKFFDPERGVWAWLGSMVDVCGLSIVWIFLCLPVVTAGPASAALYYAVVKCVRGREDGAFGSYFRSFLANLKTGVIVTLICLLAAVPLVLGYETMRRNGVAAGGVGYVLYVAYYFALAIPLGVLCWLFPLLGRFDFGVKELFRTALQLTIAHLPSTVVLVLLTAETAVFCLERWWPVLFMPSIAALLASLFQERIFRKYAPELSEKDADPEA